MPLTPEERKERKRQRIEDYERRMAAFPLEWLKVSGHDGWIELVLIGGERTGIKANFKPKDGKEINWCLELPGPNHLARFIRALVLRYNDMVEEMNENASQTVLAKAAHVEAEVDK